MVKSLKVNITNLHVHVEERGESASSAARTYNLGTQMATSNVPGHSKQLPAEQRYKLADQTKGHHSVDA